MRVVAARRNHEEHEGHAERCGNFDHGRKVYPDQARMTMRDTGEASPGDRSRAELSTIRLRDNILL
jgi:hypothetical protein